MTLPPHLEVVWHKLALLGERVVQFATTPLGITVSALGLYVVIIRRLRWRRFYAMQMKYEARLDNATGRYSLTPEEAQEIIRVPVFYDMPLLCNYAASFALFKTYGVPTISKLLLATKQLSSQETISRRYADTELLISTWLACPISGFLNPTFAVSNRAKGGEAQPAEDPRAMIAVARVNYLHGKYKILISPQLNSDYIYTLALFILEPITWASRYGWRPFSPLEEEAMFIFWREIGKRMGIADIPDSIAKLREYSTVYEAKAMVPDEANAKVAGYTLDELLAAVPSALGMKKFGEKLSICLMNEPVRIAMLYPAQPWYMHAIKNANMYSLAFVQRWLMPPRRRLHASVDVTMKIMFDLKDGACPRLHPSKWMVRPWYKPESTGLWYVWDRFLVLAGWHSEMPGPHLKSGGYRIEEMGPLKFENLAHGEVLANAAKLQGCPIAGPWSLPTAVGNGGSQAT